MASLDALIKQGWMIVSRLDDAGQFEAFAAHLTSQSFLKKRDAYVLEGDWDVMVQQMSNAQKSIAAMTKAIKAAHKDSLVEIIDEGMMIFITVKIEQQYTVYRLPKEFGPSQALPKPIGNGRKVEQLIGQYYLSLKDE